MPFNSESMLAEKMARILAYRACGIGTCIGTCRIRFGTGSRKCLNPSERNMAR